MKRKVLLGIHDRDLLCALECLFEINEYDSVNDLQEMLENAKSKDYRLYVMDLNLGQPDSDNINPVIEVYSLVKEKVETGKAKFLGISKTVSEARKCNIPAEQKPFDLSILYNLSD